MAIKKTELYSSLWASCDELRVGMDVSQYKDYVLSMLFMKYVSDKYKGDPYEVAVLKQAKKLFDAEATAEKALKEAQDALDLAVFKQYPKLSIDDIKSLIVEDTWLATLESNIVAEIERVTQKLANRVKELLTGKTRLVQLLKKESQHG